MNAQQVKAAQNDIYTFAEKYVKDNLSFNDAPSKIDTLIKQGTEIIMYATRDSNSSPEADLAEIRAYRRLKFSSYVINLPMDHFVEGLCVLIAAIIRRIVTLIFENSIFGQDGCLNTAINEHIIPFLAVLLNEIISSDRIIDLAQTLYTCILSVMNISTCSCITNQRIQKVVTRAFQDHCEPFIISLADANEAAILIQRTWRRACASPFMAVCRNRIKRCD